MTTGQAGWMGIVQGLALPFRGFSRSGSTISAGMLVGVAKEQAERFSFALAVVLTPPVVGREALRLLKASHAAAAAGVPIDLHASLVGESARHGVLLRRRNAGAQVAQQLARNRPLVSVRDLLPHRLGRGVLSSRAGVLGGFRVAHIRRRPRPERRQLPRTRRRSSVGECEASRRGESFSLPSPADCAPLFRPNAA